MTKVDVFKYTSYVKYLKKAISVQVGKGVKHKIAQAVGCQPSYLSQVLAEKVNFNLEQGLQINKYFSHTTEESKYFLWLIEYARAGNKELKNFFQNQINEIKDQRAELKNRLQNIESISSELKYKYYSSWVFSALHVALSIPTINQATQLAEKFNLPIDMVHEAIEVLKHMGLIIEERGRLVVTKKNIHLDRHNTFIQRHHINWRSKALQAVEVYNQDDLHYSSVLAIHSRDFKKLKEHFLESISSSKAIIAPSKEEHVYAMALDLFKL